MTSLPKENDRPGVMSLLRTYARLFISTFKIGALTFGGGVVMLTSFHHEFVVRRRMLDDPEFYTLVGTALAIPGPVSINLSLLLGQHRAGPIGAICAFAGIVGSGLLYASILAVWFMQAADHRLVLAFLKGAGAAVVGLIAYAAFTLGRSMIRSVRAGVLAGGMIIAVLFGLHPLLALVAVTLIEAFFYNAEGARDAGTAG